MSDEKLPVNDETIRRVLKIFEDHFEEGSVFTVIALTPAEKGEYQNWLYVSNAPRGDMIGGLETLLLKWKSNN